MERCYVILLLLACFSCPDIALADEDPTKLQGDPTKVGLMSPAEKSELYACIAKAGDIAGDEQERRILFGVYIGSKGRAVSLAVLESSGLDYLDKLVQRCLLRVNYTPTAPGKPPIQWIFRSSIDPRRSTPARSP